MKKDPRIYLTHIAESIQAIEEYTRGLSRDDFMRSIQVQDAVVRRIEIIGEAVKNIPDEFKSQHPEIPWKKVAGTRDVLIHEYFAVELGLLWNVPQKEIPVLKDHVNRLLGGLGKSR